MSSSISQKKAAYATLSFLRDALPTLKDDDKEGIEVAAQCISEAFGVALDNAQDTAAYSIAPDTLASILEAHSASSSSAPAPAKNEVKPATAEDKAAAEKHKAAGNAAMAKKDYDGAIAAYGKAIELDGQNPVYYSNRAAAHSQTQSHASAISDAQAALAIDPAFSKAYSRLGHALYSSGEYKGAVDAYEKGLEVDPGNATMKSSLATAKSRLPAATDDADDDDEEESTAPLARGAGAGAGGAGGFPGFPGMGAGGMPDLAGLMSNPAIMQMAQQMMQNGGMEQMMNNPMIRNMMNGAGGAGGMPDINALLSDPAMRAMAERMGAGMGRGGAGGAGSGEGNGNDNMYS